MNSLIGIADLADYYNFNSADYDSWEEHITDLHETNTFDANSFNYERFAIMAGFRLNESLIRCDWRGKKDSCSAKDFTKVNIFCNIFVVVHTNKLITSMDDLFCCICCNEESLKIINDHANHLKSSLI